MKFVHPELVGLDPNTTCVNTLPPTCICSCQLDFTLQRDAYFEKQKYCANLTKLPAGYRHYSCSVKHYPRPSLVYVCRSSVHGYGLFANRFIPKDAIIAEYTGTLLTSPLLTNMAEQVLLENGFDSTYLFQIGQSARVIDATFSGSVARFANHSCVPNALSRYSSGRVYLLAKRDIQIGEEVCYNYNLQFQPGMPRVKCHCGSSQCMEYMDVKSRGQ